MKGFVEATASEILKIRKSRILLLSVLFFIFVTSMMGLLVFVQMHPGIAGKLGMVGTKASMLRFGDPNWQNYLALIAQSMAAIGLVGFGFITSWVFGREFSDKTAKDILALPVPRSTIVMSKFIVVVIWSIVLSIVFYLFAILFGKLAGLHGLSASVVNRFTVVISAVSLLSVLLCTPVAFFASLSRGYLLPIAFIILTLMIANFTGLVGLGPYVPWAIPGILSAPPSEEIQLKTASYIILIATSIAGYAGTLLWWYFADHK